jgi:elongation factor P
MDTSSYEQVLIDKDVMGDSVRWLKENLECGVLFWNGKPMSVEVPNHVILKITNCEPGVRGDTATGASKPATLESGATVNVPLFVNEGDSIKIDTRTGLYIERA